MLWFGTAGSYALAASARVFGGFLNGIIGAWKCMLGECYDTLAQARGQCGSAAAVRLHGGVGGRRRRRAAMRRRAAPFRGLLVVAGQRRRRCGV